MSDWLTSSLAALREGLFLERAESTASAYPPERASRLQMLAAAARSRARVARSLTAPADDATAVDLLRDAVDLRLRAAREAGREVPGELQPLTSRALDSSDPLVLQSLGADELASMRRALDQDERTLARAVETRTVAAIRGARFGRQAALGIAVAYAIFRVVTAIVRPPDVALGKAVYASSFESWSAPPATLVDGDETSETPVVTRRAPGGWLEVDLGDNYVLDSVRMVNRHDHELDAALPFYLDVSLRSDQPWTEVARRRDHFRIWTVPLEHRVARYVRLRCESTCAIGLTELDVRGRRAN